ncbi:MAG: Protocatechuate 3,4-dioxygenase beta chain [uncultured Thermomicrobiales bacterium]|uniref:Protocatechuate 3,4-dioxygenase beta chain n=1 Tax=uncultured Thermomicrobiales bacterium TaxID=1645740 RepID=A0A6J4TMQ0_9BACT|nr:MAG: Protocatechuate 3,4-dioxygenase beta chain [uncultured Thermomicrobiales bacterium]
MDHLIRTKLSRRRLHRLAVALPVPVALAALGGKMAGVTLAQSPANPTPTAAGTPVLAPTPECADADDLDATLEQTEGPYFTPDSPERASLLEDGMPGTKLVVAGHVYSTGCAPVPGALLEFWQADDAGEYDNEGYTLRGHQFADDEGRYELTTILPGIYPGRTRHIHVKVQAPDGPVLTTQLYFPDEPENDRDGIFAPSLVLEYEDRDEDEIEADGLLGFYTYVLDVA